MEQTLGKRIAQNRKRLGLTQDALAEQLGVTAQAVSKWENDQSCPDITTLPRLAEIFGTTTDELLGLQPEKVHDVEVVDEKNAKQPKHSRQFTWDAGRWDSITFAVLVLLVGALSMANAILDWGVSFWSILWPCVPLVYGVSALLKKFSFFRIGCTLLGGYFLIQNLGIWQLNIGNELIWPAIVILFGISLIVDAVRKPKKPRFHVSRNGVKLDSDNHKFNSDFSTDEHTFACSLSFGEQTHYIDIPLLQSGSIECSFGELTVDLSGCEDVFKNCKIDADCSFGEIVLLVPSRFRVETDCSTSFAGLDIVGQPDPEPKGIIRLDANVSFGEITVKYV